MLGVDAALDGVSAMHDRALQHVIHLCASRDHELAFYEVDVRDHLCDRVFNLDARVHLDEMKFAIRAHQEFNRPGILVADCAQRLAQDAANLGAQLGCHHHRGRFFQQFLMAALDRAFALSRLTTLPCSSASTWNSMWRGFSTYFSM